MQAIRGSRTALGAAAVLSVALSSSAAAPRFEDYAQLQAKRIGTTVRVFITPRSGWFYNTAFATTVTFGDVVRSKKYAELRGHVPAEEKAAGAMFTATTPANAVTAKAVFCNADGCVGPFTARVMVSDVRVAVRAAVQAHLRMPDAAAAALEVVVLPNGVLALGRDPLTRMCVVLADAASGWRVVTAGSKLGDHIKPKLEAALKPIDVADIAEIDSALRAVRRVCGGTLE